jgi:oxalate decarboxylase
MNGSGNPSEPIDGDRGASILGPRNAAVESANPDALIAPETDAGTVPNLSRTRCRTTVLSGGWARETTTRELPVSTEIAGVNMRMKPGAMRELHWHPNADEWHYYLSGQGRLTVFASGGRARTFDYQAGDVGYAPYATGHYIENTGGEPVVFLALFRSDHYADISLARWLGLLPPELVKAHLNADDEFIAKLPTNEPLVL